MAMVATDTATAMDTTARGKLRLPLLPSLAMATMVATEDTDTVTATADMATTVTTARGRLKLLLCLRLSPRLLPSLATDTTGTDMAMDITERGLLMLDTMAMVATAMAMVTDMAM